MRLPARLLHRKKNSHKNDFGHILILAGSQNMLGAACLSSLAAMRSGAGLVTVGISKSLNLTLQKKLSCVVMTLPLAETKDLSLGNAAFKDIPNFKFDVLAMGPGLGRHPQTIKLLLNLVSSIEKPMVIDADALNAVAIRPQLLLKTDSTKILTPHSGEMSRLTGLSKQTIEQNRKK